MVKKLSIFATFAAPLALMGTAVYAQGTAAPAAPAAEATAQVAVGATVYDSTGAEVGKVKSVAAPNFVIDTGKNTATLALSALGTSPKGPVLGLTREQLDTAAEKAAADAAAALASAIAVDAIQLAIRLLCKYLHASSLCRRFCVYCFTKLSSSTEDLAVDPLYISRSGSSLSSVW